MAACPFFGKCGGCRFDFADDAYRAEKMSGVKKLPITGDAVWVNAGMRRRADFAFAPGQFGFFASTSKDIIPVTNCPNLVPEINAILPMLAALPWDGAGSCLVTLCDNGIDVAIIAGVPYFGAEFKNAANKLPIIRMTWNEHSVVSRATPMVNFSGRAVEYPSGAFLQPTISGADVMRDMVVRAADGFGRVADLFCGLGNFTFALNADGFDVVGTGVKRDLFKKPLTPGMLATYDCVVMDPPRAGADAQSRILATSNVRRVIYVSCNPNTWRRDAETLTRGGYKLTTLVPVDQFVGSTHWELFSVFDK